ncbi:hypothetical protein DWB68_09385 [Galactobacter valiniphilus]|uniref:Uncharacterized protein n=1 Tax=Galactobacter valiniphilus TaxID=2676122 RepID=A0A399J8Y2_9MICC|nr:hypothetical protein DWB68_09385 [Galactobacter valiniphilus]
MVEDGKAGRVTKTFTAVGVVLAIIGAIVLWQSLAALEPEEARWGWRVGTYEDRENGSGYVSFHLFVAALALAAILLGAVIAFAARLTFVWLLADATRSELKHVRLGHRLLEERVDRLEQAGRTAARDATTTVAAAAAAQARPTEEARGAVARGETRPGSVASPDGTPDGSPGGASDGSLGADRPPHDGAPDAGGVDRVGDPSHHGPPGAGATGTAGGPPHDGPPSGGPSRGGPPNEGPRTDRGTPWD